MKWYINNRIYLRRINNFLNLLGIQLKRILSLINMPRYLKNYIQYKNSGGKITNIYPMFDDFSSSAGEMKNHLFHADLLTSQFIFEDNPKKHLDIGSRIDGLVASIASYRKLDVIDIRELDVEIHKNINFIKMDISNFENLNNKINQYQSISSIGCIAHVGLGRYGDPIDPQGHIKAIKNISKLAMKDCKIYTLVPIGKEGVEFNAHRIFNPEKFVYYFTENDCILDRFHLINDHGQLILNSNFDEAKNLNFGGGYFVFKKK